MTFLPNIFILFGSGLFGRQWLYCPGGVCNGWNDVSAGALGTAFIPMVLGFGCTVPAIMASRVLEDKRDRYKTMLVTPFMSCSARLPIYVLFSMFFAQYAMLAAPVHVCHWPGCGRADSLCVAFF